LLKHYFNRVYEFFITTDRAKKCHGELSPGKNYYKLPFKRSKNGGHRNEY